MTVSVSQNSPRDSRLGGKEALGVSRRDWLDTLRGEETVKTVREEEPGRYRPGTVTEEPPLYHPV